MERKVCIVYILAVKSTEGYYSYVYKLYWKWCVVNHQLKEENCDLCKDRRSGDIHAG